MTQGDNVPGHSHPPRQTFVDLIDDLHRHLGLQMPDVPDATGQPLTLDLTWNGEDFTLQHVDPSATAGCMRVQCRFGTVPEDDMDRILAQALAANSALARQQAGMFALDVADRGMVFSFIQPLAATHAADLTAAMRRIAQAAQSWRQRNACALH
jgi:hypothetical protein